MSAYYAIRAPKIPGTQTRGPIRLHKALAWIHGPGMILTPILGAIAFDQKSNGEKVHGIASAHGAGGHRNRCGVSEPPSCPCPLSGKEAVMNKKYTDQPSCFLALPTLRPNG